MNTHIPQFARHKLYVSRYDVAPREGTFRVRRKILLRLLKRFISHRHFPFEENSLPMP